MKTEKALFKHTKKLCAWQAVACFKLRAEGRAGWPDVFLAHHGHVVLVELKSPANTGKVSRLQEYMHKLLTNFGVEIYVVSQPETIATLITNLVKREPKPSYRPLI